VPRPRGGDPLDDFSPEEVRACLAYAKPRQAWSLVAAGADLALLVLLALSGPGRWLLGAAAGPAGWWTPARALLAAVAVVAAEALVALPFSLRAWRQDRRAGLATQPAGGFLRDLGKSRALGAALTAVPLAALVGAARARPPGWPWLAAAVAALLVAALGLLGPVLLEPLFNRFTPLPDGPLRRGALDLAARMGVPVRDVLVADASRRTTRVNAYVSGLGRTRRVVLYDTLEHQASEQEVLLVLAHELAHVRHRDVPRATAAGAAAAAAAVLAADRLFAAAPLRRLFRVGGLGDPLVAPALLLLVAVAAVAVAPLGSWLSRRAEARADWAALEATGDPATAVRLERTLAVQNRVDLRPNRLLLVWFASHPPTTARIAQARLWQATHAAGPSPAPPSTYNRPL
jgi:STE24 endopeptidase